MPKYVLHYFDGKGRAEPIRMLFALADIPYTDNRFQMSDWPTIKPTTPLGQAPYLEIDDQILPQSHAIVRYLAREANLYGSNNLESAQIDAVLDTVQDGINLFYTKVRVVRDPEAQKEAAIKFLTEDTPKNLANVEKLVQLYSKSSGFAVGSNLSVADIVVYANATYSPQIQSIAENLPGINAIIKNVSQQPRIAAYLQSRPETSW